MTIKNVFKAMVIGEVRYVTSKCTKCGALTESHHLQCVKCGGELSPIIGKDRLPLAMLEMDTILDKGWDDNKRYEYKVLVGKALPEIVRLQMWDLISNPLLEKLRRMIKKFTKLNVEAGHHILSTFVGKYTVRYHTNKKEEAKDSKMSKSFFDYKEQTFEQCFGQLLYEMNPSRGHRIDVIAQEYAPAQEDRVPPKPQPQPAAAVQPAPIPTQQPDIQALVESYVAKALANILGNNAPAIIGEEPDPFDVQP